MRQPAPPDQTLRARRGRALLAALLGIGAAALAAELAWISDDAFITLRYVDNTLAGRGAVFNVGERVLGHTHPLWWLLLTAAAALLGDPVVAAITLGLALTAAAVFAMALPLARATESPWLGAVCATLATLALCSSGAFLSFSTSGLENPLTHLLLLGLLAELLQRRLSRPGRVALILSLLVLTRPDHALLALPLAFALLRDARSARGARALALGALPLLCWSAFALGYYGDVVPNTARAKLGLYADPLDGVVQGLRYLLDLTTHEPWVAAPSWLALAYASLRLRERAPRALALGLWLHLGYVAFIGGDFMRGRFLLPVVVCALPLGLHALVREPSSRLRRTLPAASVLACVALLAAVVTARARRDLQRAGPVPASGIVDERAYYPGHAFASYRRLGTVHSAYTSPELVPALRRYVAACGPVTIHARNPGAIAYFAGPQVTVIDLLGLTDATIARLPRELLVERRPRVGHPDKRVPVGYLARRGDVAFLAGFGEAVRERDCAFRDHAAAYLGSTELWRPPTLLPIRD